MDIELMADQMSDLAALNAHEEEVEILMEELKVGRAQAELLLELREGFKA